MAEKNSQEFVIATRDATDESQGMVNKGAIMSTYEQSRYNCCGSDYAARVTSDWQIRGSKPGINI